ncbi:hypothetical protein BGZ95_008425, partial [Linnemannia exigua]
MIRAVLLSNHFLRYTGYTDFTRRFSPAPSISTLHPIPLSAAGIYEVLCPSTDHHFDAKIDETHSITSVEHANKNQMAVFSNFFDLKKIEKVCATYGLEFAKRLTFVNSFMTRVLGEVRPAFQGRGGSPVVSDLEDAKKDKSQRRQGRDWRAEGARTGITQEDAKRRLIELETELNGLEILQEEKRKRWLGADQERYELSVLERMTSNT